MPEGSYQYCDVSLPVPVDQLFTYSLPETLRHRVQIGSRLMVPFGPRKLTGVILRCHDDRPDVATRDALRLIDSAPVLDGELLALGRWIAGYYCAPLGDVLRGMLPLASEMRQGKIWSLTDAGRDAARQLLLDSAEDDLVVKVLRMLEKRPLSASYLAKALPLADKAVKSLERKGFIVVEQVQTERDPLRAPSDRLRVELNTTPPAETKLNKPERELRAFLELHPGSHNLKELEATVRNASLAARSLARKGFVSLKPEAMEIDAGPVRVRHALNPAQQAAYDQIAAAIASQRFQRFSSTASPDRVRPRSTSTVSRPPWRKAAARCCWFRRSRSPPRWPANSSRDSATASPSSTAPSPTWSAPSSGAAYALEPRPSWSARAPAFSRR